MLQPWDGSCVALFAFVLKLACLAFGLVFLVGLVWHAGPQSILEAIAQFGLPAMFVIMIPMMMVYALEAWGWRLTLGPFSARIGFARLFAIRMAGETINVTTPTAYIGGEPMKALFLKHYGVPMVDALASVITAKTTMTMAQVLFILLGMGLAVGLLGSVDHHLMAMIVSLMLLGFGVGMFVAFQRYGLVMGCVALLERVGIRIAYLEQRKAKLRDLDRMIQSFYTHHARTFYLALCTFFLAWMTEALEVYAILYFLGQETDILASVSLAALTVLIKGGTFFIPGSLGAQEGGYVLLLMMFGYSEITGVTFALVRRLREILWILIGLGCLVWLKQQSRVDAYPNPPKSERPQEQQMLQ
ncbi:MAG: TIGR00374 family protein [Nitrospirae bacterium]|nr:MAG: TIGR00374 family protein [Nitrospirota bacterium]